MNHEEYAIQCAVVKHCRQIAAPGTFLFHPFNRPSSPKEGARAKAMGMVAGIPDLIGCRDGYFYALELKTKKGKLSPAQHECLDAIDQAGGIQASARGLDEALAQLKRWGFL